MTRQWQSAVRAVAATAILAGTLFVAPANAQVYQINRADARNPIGFNLGYFALRGEDSRVEEDVLLANLFDLAFEIDDFNGFSFGGEWLYGVTEYIEVGAGIGYYGRGVDSVYRDFIDGDGSEIAQELKLRIVPITATVRFLPLPRGSAVEPYIGAGLGIFPWRYSETGEFIADDGSIIRDRFSADGTAVGPVVLGGLRVPVGDAFTFGGEFRWQRAEGDTDAEITGLFGDKIDLGGWTTSFTFHFRF